MKQTIFSILCSAAISLLVSGCKSGAKKKPHVSFNGNHALQDSLNSDPNTLLTAYPLTNFDTPLLSLVARELGTPRDPGPPLSISMRLLLPESKSPYPVHGLSKEANIDTHPIYHERRFRPFDDQGLFPVSKIQQSDSCFVLVTDVESSPFMSKWIHLFHTEHGIVSGLKVAEHGEWGSIESNLSSDWTLELENSQKVNGSTVYSTVIKIDNNCKFRLVSMDSTMLEDGEDEI